MPPVAARHAPRRPAHTSQRRAPAAPSLSGSSDQEERIGGWRWEEDDARRPCRSELLVELAVGLDVGDGSGSGFPAWIPSGSGLSAWIPDSGMRMEERRTCDLVEAAVVPDLGRRWTSTSDL